MTALGDKDGATTGAVTAKDGGVQVRKSGDKRAVISNAPSPSHDKTALPNTVEGGATDIERPPRNNSPKSHLEFDVKATKADDNKHLKTNHSHDAYEIQHKTQAMRDLDVLVGNDIDDEDEPVKVTFALDVVLDDEKKSKKGKRRRGRRPAKRKDPRHGEWLFSCTMDDIDEVVEDLISPFDGITNFITCQGDDDDSTVEKGEKGEKL
mmetsp:Transcript_27943/g.43923  ORF Transcript_27943/g.43923 Transcript_27943/m.43923 type:complete len:208 (+) Transcript_27943:129-752(+)